MPTDVMLFMCVCVCFSFIISLLDSVNTVLLKIKGSERKVKRAKYIKLILYPLNKHIYLKENLL